MISYYSAVLLLCWLALIILSLLIWENDRMARSDKQLLYLTYALIILSSLAEWGGVQLDGKTHIPVWVLIAVKCADYILTPLAGGALSLQLRLRTPWRWALIGVLTFNTLYQLVSVFTGWMLTVDEAHHYTHSLGYILYILLCLFIIALVCLSFVLYGQPFRKHNRKSLYAIIAFIAIGVGIQEGMQDHFRTTYLTLTMGAALMFIHYTEFTFLKLDDQVAVQQLQLDTDALTGLSSRHAYSAGLKVLSAMIPDDLAVFIIDINGLKEVNDKHGHEAGDELIRSAAKCIRSVFGDEAHCYRTGGDEFAVLANLSRAEAEDRAARLKSETARWHGEAGQSLSMAIGYALASENPDYTIQQLLREADMAMYASKAEYYSQDGHNRRYYRR